MFSNDNPPSSIECPQEELDTPYDYSPQIHSLSHGSEHSTKISAHLCSIHSGATHSVTVLLDSGATGMFIDQEFVRCNNLETNPLPEAIPVYNVNGTTNHNGSIHEVYEVILEIGTHSE